MLASSSLRVVSSTPARTFQICSRCLSTASRQAVAQRTTSTPLPSIRHLTKPSLKSAFNSTQPRPFTTSAPRRASAATADEAILRIEELYENASEEFQIAAEETEGNTVYAADDRAAAKAEVEKLEEFYRSVVEGTGYEAGVRDEVKRRAGQRVRELANAMTALEERAMHQD